MAKATGSHLVVYAALVGNFLIALSKFAAAAVSGSSAMLSEGVHSLVDTSNELLLLYGMHRARKAPDELHPFGYGRELYFWSFIVALLVFAAGAGVSMLEGLHHLREPEPMTRPMINYIVLGVSMLFEGTSWVIALREFRRKKKSLGYFQAFRQSKDPTTFTVLFEDSAALLGLVIAFLGVFGAQWFDEPRVDAWASIGIAAVLVVAAVLLARETKGLLIGEAAHPNTNKSIRDIAQADDDVRCANGVLTMQMGADQVVAALSAEFEDHLNTQQIEACVRRIEDQAKHSHPDLMALFVKPQTPEVWQARMDARRRNA